jgi:hypothetical protein
METLLEATKTQALRESGIIKTSEIVKIVGDIWVAEDVVTGARRMIQNVGEATQTQRKVLRD